jgi:outer membrane protein assembly factor BamB
MNLLPHVAALLLAVSAPAADWPQWMGPHRDGHAGPGAFSAKTLSPAAEPMWKHAIGGGFSSPVVVGDRVVYCDIQNDQEVAHAVELATGKELWATKYSPGFGDEWGPGPRATPVVDGDRVYVQSCVGEFRCLDLKDGKVHWGTSFEKDFGVRFLGNKANEGTAARRGNNGTSVVNGDTIYVPVGSTAGASLVAFEKLTGKVIWKAGDDEAAYAALQIADIAGTPQVVYFTADALCGYSCTDGKSLWRAPLRTNAKRHAATPLLLGDRIVVNSHTFGTLAFEIGKSGDTWTATKAASNPQMKINLASLVAIGGHLYGHGQSRNFVCLDAGTLKQAWAQDGFGKELSSTIALDDQRLLVLTDLGEMVLVAADPKEYRELGRLQVCGKTWSMPAVAGDHVVVREGLTDGWKLSCWNFGK